MGVRSIIIFIMLSPYHRFAVQKEKLWKDMPDRERKILLAILGQDPENQMRVMDIILCAHLGSQATIHAALTNLHNAGYLRYTSYTVSGRSKFITLAPKSLTLFKSLNKLLMTCSLSAA